MVSRDNEAAVKSVGAWGTSLRRWSIDERGTIMKPKNLVYALLVVLLTLPALAQPWLTRTEVNVPFDFVVGDVALPAGEYQISSDKSGKLFQIQNADDPRQIVTVFSSNIMLEPYSHQPTTKLVFVVDQGRHVLHQIRFESDDHTHDIMHGDNVAELVEPD